MKVIFCISNLFVPATLTLIEKAESRSVLIYTDQEGIYHFFKVLELDNLILFYRPITYLKKDIRILAKYLKERNVILKQLSSYNPTELYFFHNTFGGIVNWLIRKMSSDTQVFHIPIFNKLAFVKRYSWSALKGVIISNVINRTEVVPLWTGERYIYQLRDSYYRKINAQTIDIIPNIEYIKKLIEKKFNLSDHKIVLLTGSIVELGLVEEQEYTTKINNLIKTFRKERFIAKPHPRFPNRYGLEKELELIPSYVPANVLFKKYKVFIGYTTTVLTEAANEGLVAISFVDYLEPVNHDRRENYKRYLLKNLNAGKILFPKSLKGIIENTK